MQAQHSALHSNVAMRRLAARQLAAGTRLLASQCTRSAAACSATSSGTQPGGSLRAHAVWASQLAAPRGEQQQQQRRLSAAAALPAAADADAPEAAEASTSYGAQQIQVRSWRHGPGVRCRPSLSGSPACRRHRRVAFPPPPPIHPCPRSPAGAARPGAGAQAAGHVHRQYRAARPAPPGV